MPLDHHHPGVAAGGVPQDLGDPGSGRDQGGIPGGQALQQPRSGHGGELFRVLVDQGVVAEARCTAVTGGAAVDVRRRVVQVRHRPSSLPAARCGPTRRRNGSARYYPGR
ncbi:hypothetical protein GCM10011381_01770 [Klenkia taihuensis]|nr:hypothetical protein GCM10011381_01770 [Klenkia taihuensis]